MAFTPRTFDEILDDMIAYMQANTILSDFTVGSVIRTILEAAATEDDEQYFQMTQLLDAFAYTTASGEDLDRRLSDFNISRLSAKTSTGSVQFHNNNLVRTQISTDNTAGGLTLTVFDVSIFPTPSPTLSIRVGEDSTRVQDVICISVDFVTNILTLSTPLIFDVRVGDRVALIEDTTETVNLGTQVLAPPTVSENAKVFSTQEPAYILPGNYYSNAVRVRALAPGEIGNVGARRVSQFQSGPPFTGAGVINLTAISGGVNRESDEEFRQRAVEALQGLSRGTPLALKNAAVGVEVPNTGQRVVSANIIEDYENEEVIMYVDDGTGLVPDTVALPADSLDGTQLATSVLTVFNVSDFPSSGFVLIEDDLITELHEYVNTDTITQTITLAGTTASTHDDGTIVINVEVITDNAEAGQTRFQIQQFPIVRSTQRVFQLSAGTWTELLEETDYILNKGTGEIQLITGLLAGSTLVAQYNYYTGLIAEVQRVLEGNIDNPDVYPGYKAAGIFLAVEAPVIKRITVVMNISAEAGFREEDLRASVQSNVEAYINSLKIGEDVITSKMIDVAHDVAGVRNVIVTTPTTTTITILENELPVAFDSDGDSLVTVL